MTRRFQFSLKWLLVATLAVSCFFGGIHFEREWRRRELLELDRDIDGEGPLDPVWVDVGLPIQLDKVGSADAQPGGVAVLYIDLTDQP
jgi:hypothetical protein